MIQCHSLRIAFNLLLGGVPGREGSGAWELRFAGRDVQVREPCHVVSIDCCNLGSAAQILGRSAVLLDRRCGMCLGMCVQGKLTMGEWAPSPERVEGRQTRKSYHRSIKLISWAWRVGELRIKRFIEPRECRKDVVTWDLLRSVAMLVFARALASVRFQIVTLPPRL
jgi:hypothetical protein